MNKLSKCILLLLLGIVVLTGCSANNKADIDKLVVQAMTDVDYSSFADVDMEKGSTIAFVLKDTKSEFWQVVMEGASTAVADLNKALGYEGDDKIKIVFDAPASELDIDQQINIIDAVLAENPSVLCLAATDVNSCEAQLESAKENKIPVIAFDSGLEKGEIETICAVDNYEAAREAARQLCKLIGDSGKVAMLAHNPDTQTSVDRQKGFVDEINENHPNVEIIIETSEEESDISLEDNVVQILEAHPEIDAYFGTDEKTTTAIVNGCEKADRSDVVSIGFDSGRVLLKAIEDGRLAGTISQNPYGMGYITVVAAARSAVGLENDSFIDIGYQWICQDNMYEEAMQNYIYE